MESHSMNTLKLKYAYNKLKKNNPLQGKKQYGLEVFSTNGTSDVVFLNEFTWIGVADTVSTKQYNIRFSPAITRMNAFFSLTYRFANF